MLFDLSRKPVASPHYAVAKLEQSSEPSKVISISQRHRRALQRVVAGELRRCSARELHTLLQRGWIHGPYAGYQLTPLGHRLIDLCEQFPAGKELNVRLSPNGEEILR